MANRIYIKMLNQINGEEDYILDSPIPEDIALEIQTTYQDVSDLFPSGFNEILSLVKTGSQIIGSTSKGLEDIVNQPIWQKTEPLKISTNLMFYTKNDPIEDVMLPTWSICALNVLTDLSVANETKTTSGKGKNKKTTSNTEYTTQYKIPGISFSDAKLLRGKNTARSIIEQNSKEYGKLFKNETKSTVCSVLIPGIIFLPIALCLAGKPTFSKELASVPYSNEVYPIWSKVDIEIRSITPASLSMLKSQFGSNEQNLSRSELGNF